MQPRTHLLLPLLLLLAALPHLAAAQTSAQLAFPGPPRPQQWELLTLKLPAPPGGATVSIKDDRGGLEVARNLEGATIDPVTGESQILLPLPLLAPADLPPDTWPVEVTVQPAIGTAIHQIISIARNPTAGGGGATTGATAEAPATFRVIRPSDAPKAPLAWPQAHASPIVFLTMPDDEILTGPPLLFASADALLLTDRLTTRLTAERIAALLNTGIQLAILRDPAGPGSGPVLGRLAWLRAGEGPSQCWITVPSTYARPNVLEDGLARARTLDVSASPSRATLATVLLVPIAALIALLLARGLFRSQPLVLTAAIVGLLAVAAIAIAYLRSSDPPAVQSVSWTNTDVRPAAAAAHTSLCITDSFTATSALFRQHLHQTAEQDTLLFPVTDSVRHYFARTDATLLLDTLADDGIRRLSRLDMNVRRRGLAIYALRSASLLAGASDLPRSGGAWIEAGYVTPTAVENDEPQGAAPSLVTRWAARHPAQKDTLLTWYELRFQATHRYFMRPAADTETPDAPGAVTFLDFGPSTTISPPP